MALSVLVAILFAALLLVTPSVGNAPRLIRNLERTHRLASVGRDVPARFLAALTAIQYRGHDSRSGSVSDVTAFVGQLVEPSTPDNPAIDQRLASMLYVRNGKGELAHIEQAVLVLKLRWHYSESALMRMYAAVASFGHGYYGLMAASCGYFGQRPGHLSWAQVALLAAAAANPATDDPYVHLVRAKRDQAAVMRELVAAGTLGSVQAVRFGRQPLHLRGVLVRSQPRNERRHHQVLKSARAVIPACT
ncbi:MAG: transglycosylase domain-containing protein [Streptosporangiaceae bacterium]